VVTRDDELVGGRRVDEICVVLEAGLHFHLAGPGEPDEVLDVYEVKRTACLCCAGHIRSVAPRTLCASHSHFSRVLA